MLGGHFFCLICLVVCLRILLGNITLFLYRNVNNLGTCKQIRWGFLKNYAAWRKLWRIQNSARNATWPYLRQKDAIKWNVGTVRSTSVINATVRSLDMIISGVLSFSNNYVVPFAIHYGLKTCSFLFLAGVLVCFFLKRNLTDGKCRWIKGSSAKLLHRCMQKCICSMVQLIHVQHAVNHLQR